jgi:hypothetical protein
MSEEVDAREPHHAAVRLIRLSKAEPFDNEPIEAIKTEFSARGELDELIEAFELRAADTLSMAVFERTFAILKR